ncbi:MAG: DUF4493 domain-containing protein [Rikenellaceae bacterium]
MRIQIRKLIAAAMVVIAALSVSCSMDDVDFSQSDSSDILGGDTSEVNVGYLSISNMALYVDFESETIGDTKAVDSSFDTSNYYIVITSDDSDSDFETIVMKYSDIADSKLELPVGNYTLQARSYESMIDVVGWDKPEYASIMYPFSIKANEVTEQQDDAICTLANIMVTVEVSDELLAKFDDDVKVSVTYGDSTIYYSLNNDGVLVGSDGAVAYFALQDSITLMTMVLSGSYNTAAEGETPVYEFITWEQEIDGVNSGQHRQITLTVAEDAGSTSVSVGVSSSVYEGEVDVDIMNGTFFNNGEAVIPDGDTSSESDELTCGIVWRAGYSFSLRHTISTSSTLPVVFDLTSGTGITSLTIDITSDTLTEELLSEMYLSQSMDLINPATDEMAGALGELGFPTGADIEGLTYLEIDITDFMPALALIANSGDETDFKITLGDASGECDVTLMVIAE